MWVRIYSWGELLYIFLISFPSICALILSYTLTQVEKLRKGGRGQLRSHVRTRKILSSRLRHRVLRNEWCEGGHAAGDEFPEVIIYCFGRTDTRAKEGKEVIITGYLWIFLENSSELLLHRYIHLRVCLFPPSSPSYPQLSLSFRNNIVACNTYVVANSFFDECTSLE